MQKAGHPKNQSWAAAYSNARRHPRADGGLAADDDAPPVAALQFTTRSPEADNRYNDDSPVNVVPRDEGEGSDDAARAKFDAWARAFKGLRANRDRPISLASGGDLGGYEPESYIATPHTPPGLLASGNIDIDHRPAVRNQDGSVSSVRSMSFNDDGREVLIPTVVGDRVVDDDEAIDEYRRRGQHLGIFDTPDNATGYAQRLHEHQENRMDEHPRGSLAPKDIPHKGFGGGLINLPSESPAPPSMARQAQRELYHPGGLIKSGVAGRTDRIPMSVAANSYVLPADVVSGLGQGNTLSGARVLDHAFKSGPWGTTMPRGGGRGRGAPPAPAPWHPPHQTMAGGFAMGGVPHGVEPVKIIAAGGEFIVSPDVVQHHPMLGKGNMRRGHEVLDAFVKHVRSQTTKTLQKLPGPKRD